MRQLAKSSYPPFHPLASGQPPLGLSEPEFHALFPGEGTLVEFKTGIGERAIQDAVVAFSNTDGGVVLIGVGDEGNVLGRELTQRSEETIHQAIAMTRNPGQYSLNRLVVDDQSIIVLAVAPRVEGFAQTSNGRVLVRQGPRNNALFDADLLRFVQERALDRFELHASGVARADADEELVERLAHVYGWGTDDLDDRLLEQRLITHGGELTIAGALYLLAAPGERIGKALIELLRFPKGSTDYDRRIEISGPLDQQVTQATAAVLDELGTELVVLGVQRHQLPRLPPVVIREAVANAVAHRSYEANRSAVRIEIHPDAVRVISPGPLPVPVTTENIRDAQAPRNLAVIRVLRRFALAEDAGRGVDVMQDEMRAELLEPPSFHDTGHSVEVELPVRSPVTARERAWVREVERRGEIVPSDRILLVHAARGDVLTNRRARDLTGLDRVEATRALKRLTSAGFLRQHGTRGGANYALEGSLNPPAGLRLDPEEIKSAIVTMATEGSVTNGSIRKVMGLERTEVRRLLSELVNEGRLEQRGARRGSHYVLPASDA